MPGGRANRLISNDPRILISELPFEVAQLMNDDLSPRDRNALWYRNIYLKTRELPAVSNTHREYLLRRDAASGVFMIFVVILTLDLALRSFGIPIMNPFAYFVKGDVL